MNILLIGNGFDLAHGLPTKYTDFLEFIRVIKEMLESFRTRDKREIEIGKLHYEVQKKIQQNIKEMKNDIFSQEKMWNALIENNFWIEYFQKNKNYQKENWIDFESEISQVIQSFDKDLHNSYQSLNEKLIINESVNDDKISNTYLKNTYSKYNVVQKYSKVRDDLLYDLNRLIRAFEIYLTEYVEKIDIDTISPDIKKLDIDYVLSFNYTHTFSKKYRVSEKGAETQERSFDYIHGEANTDNTIDSNNMVLGIDEYLPKDRKDKDIEFIGFKKYFQRIYKGTGCKYKKWLDIIERDPYNKISNENHNLYIFGHSLDDTDGDILRDLILNDYIYTRIFYYNKSVLSQQIANLVKVIGQDELIERTGGGSARTIEFIKQQDMESVK